MNGVHNPVISPKEGEKMKKAMSKKKVASKKKVTKRANYSGKKIDELPPNVAYQRGYATGIESGQRHLIEALFKKAPKAFDELIGDEIKKRLKSSGLV